MNSSDRLMALAQIWLSIILLVFTFAVTLIYELGWSHLTTDQDKTFSNSINWLQGAALIVIYFWFQRTRTAGIPDPSQIITQTHTTPDGAKTVITSPATSPAGVPNIVSSATPAVSTVTIQTPAANAAVNQPVPPTLSDKS